MQTTTLVQPTAPRYVARQQGGTLRITLPSRKQWLLIVPNALFVAVWLAIVLGALTLGLPALVSALFTQPAALAESIPLLLFGLVWISFFSLGGLTALYTTLWNLTGREVMEVSRQSIRLSRVVPGWTRTREYQATHIRDVRVSPQTLPLFYRRQMGWFNLGDGRGQLAFDYGARTIRFAEADEAEAKLILAEIVRRFPQFAPAADQVTGQPASK